MTEWRQTTLGEVTTVVGGGTPSTKNADYWGDEVPWLTPGEVTKQDGRVITSTERSITRVGLANSSAKLLPKGAVLLTSRATVGAVALAGCDMATNQGFQSLIAGDVVLPRYLMFWVQQNREEFQSRASGSTFPEISGKKVRGIPIRVPPLVEQRRIVDVISSVDAQTRALEAEASAMDAQVGALRRHMLAVEEAVDVRMSDVATFASGYAFPPRHQGCAEGDYPFIKVSDMNLPENSRVMTTAANSVTEVTLGTLKAKAWPVGTVVFPKVGAALLTEKRRVLGVEAAFDNNVMGLVPGVRLRSAYLLAVMAEVRLGDFAQHGAVPSVNQSHVGGIEFRLPSLDEQDRICADLHSAYENLDALRREADSLRAFRSTLLASLLNQSITIPDSYDDLFEVAS